MTAILACDVFPQLERVEPLSTTDEDEIPPKFGPKWFEEERKDEEQKRGDIDDENHDSHLA